MTKDAQAALRRTMETYSKVTRFCIVCNYVSRIIEPIVSRCAKFRFKPLETTVLTARLGEIAEKESLEVEKAALDRIVTVSEGDMRRALTIMQSSCRMFGKKLMEKHIDETAAIVPKNEINDLFESCVTIPDDTDAFDNLHSHCKNVIRQGHSVGQVISQLHDLIITTSKLSNLQKGRIALEIASVDKNLIDGADEFLQLVSLCSFIMRIKMEMNIRKSSSQASQSQSSQDKMQVD
jgi:replication factor C subunit 2/4